MSGPRGDSPEALIEVLSPGLGMSLQDLGQPRWRRFGMPPGGAMDQLAATSANCLLQNPDDAPVLEMLLQGGRFRFLKDTFIAVTGAVASDEIPTDRVLHMIRDRVLTFSRNRAGVWIYLAVHRGFDVGDPRRDPGPRFAGWIGQSLGPGTRLRAAAPAPGGMAPELEGRTLPKSTASHAASPLIVPVWPAPQWDLFSHDDRALFFSEGWRISAQSNRVGYRLEGPVLRAPAESMISEPIRTGAIQVPDNGQPIVIMRDGPTVGGYPKLGVVDPEALSLLAQCRPGQTVRFTLVS